MGIDVLWVGARTSVNPFAVQEIADALQGVDIPVLVKNPVNPDLALWIGALERLNKAGITKLAAVHRGFSTYEKTLYRNRPQWELPIELMRRLPDLPLLCDPSHICGRRDLLQAVAQKAMDLNFDGLMIKSHIRPDEALSDAEQQLTPTDYAHLIAALVMRQSTTNDPLFLHNVEELRELIDETDNELMSLLVRRMQFAEEIGHHKLQNNITILQLDRWDELIRRRCEMGKLEGLSNEFMLDLYNAIHKEAIRHQEAVMNPKALKIKP